MYHFDAAQCQIQFAPGQHRDNSGIVRFSVNPGVWPVDCVHFRISVHCPVGSMISASTRPCSRAAPTLLQRHDLARPLAAMASAYDDALPPASVPYLRQAWRNAEAPWSLSKLVTPDGSATA